jgi:histidinol-phosphate aminotransferase
MNTIQRLQWMNESSSSANNSRIEQVSVPKRLVPPHIEALNAYQPGRPADALKAELGIDRFINLASNENPLGPPKSALDAMRAAMQEVNRYPESGGFKLRETLAEVYRVKPENVVVGSGSESIMANIVRAFLHGDDEVVTSEGTFIGIYVLVNSQGVKLVKVPLKNYKFDLDGIAEAVTEKTKLVYLCNPNNPTGTMFSREEFESFIKKVPDHVLVILDEAYFEFTMGIAEFPDSMTYRYDNVLTLRSFSKAYAMAGLRVGYGMGHEYLINYVNKVKLPFEPNSLAQVAATAAIKDTTYLGGVLENNDEGMRYLTNEFEHEGWEYVPSSTNFIMLPTESPEKVKRIHEALLREGVAIRPLVAFGLPHCFRITIGLPDENEACVKALKKVM